MDSHDDLLVIGDAGERAVQHFHRRQLNVLALIARLQERTFQSAVAILVSLAILIMATAAIAGLRKAKLST